MSAAASGAPAVRRAGTARAIRPHAGRAAAFLKALANEQRLMIVCHLLDRPLAVGDLNARIRLSQSALSQHLAVLRASGVVRARRVAQNVVYSLPPGDVPRLIALLHSRFCER
jgi:DNA-binding transcriptional ArsR family regulator